MQFMLLIYEDDAARVEHMDEWMPHCGAYAETREQLGGFFLIEARDRQQAIELAASWPSARLGSIEVRPIEEALREERRYFAPC